MELTYSKIRGGQLDNQKTDGSGDELAYVEFGVDLVEEEEISPLIGSSNPI